MTPRITKRLPSAAPQALASSEVPALWLDRLLDAVVGLPLADGEHAVTTAMVDAVAAILPDYAVGACLVSEAHEAASRPTEPIVVTRLPQGVVVSSGPIDPTRLFPGLRREHVVVVGGGAGGARGSSGSTLHVASDVDDLHPERSSVVQLFGRAARALGQALSVSRARAPSEPAVPSTDDFADRMIQAEKLATFGQIAAGIVHELNNPLTSIVAYSDYLIRKAVSSTEPQDADDVERLRRISESANRMLRFTRDFVTYARPSAGVAGPVILHAVIDQAVAFCEHVLSQAQVSVERRYGPDVLTVRGVSEQLVQVFVNLLTNASQAAPDVQGRIVVATSIDSPSRRAVVAVEDNGTGIAPQHLRQVFEPFFTTKGDRHGTGLGLSIVKSILEGHGGAIRIESPPGGGARFVLELPIWHRT